MRRVEPRRYCRDCMKKDEEQEVEIIKWAAGVTPNAWRCPEHGSLEKWDTLTTDDIREHEERCRYWARRPGFQCEPGGDPI